ncbi:cytosolic Fe-S cluster assembly factor NUBP2-like [Sycon ciliatum]|uniref:cytosolic Fe-S cluster assembly factor NUBP2-like n=1 Tax=Sycon ciliatum TaxID=27933 RepID=UPI0031F67A73
MAESLRNVKHVILVLSGKGGVGKSTLSAQLALALVKSGLKVGLLDIDLCGPSIPKMFGVDGQNIHQCPEGWVPVFTDQSQQLALMSIGFLLTRPEEAVVWRGPKKNAMVKQFVTDVYWGERDVLIIDTPPGTSDEHITVVEALREFHPDGAVLVTTSQAVAVADVRRELSFCRKTGLNVLGLVENMSGFVCPTCSECTNIFSQGGGESFAEQSGIPFLGRVPLDPSLTASLESGSSFAEKFPGSPTFAAVQEIAARLLPATTTASSNESKPA